MLRWKNQKERDEMRLWHEELIPFLPRPQLLGQHRECCALRGKGWGRKHATVDYIFSHSPLKLVQYHFLIMEEMEKRGYKVSADWWEKTYRGKVCPAYPLLEEIELSRPIYPEHDSSYLEECLGNLWQKGISIKGLGQE